MHIFNEFSYDLVQCLESDEFLAIDLNIEFEEHRSHHYNINLFGKCLTNTQKHYLYRYVSNY